MSDATSELAAFLSALYSHAPAAALIELRYRTSAGMRRRFFGVGAQELLVPVIFDLVPRTDVYIGVLPRRRPGGRRNDLVREASVLWADCDTPAASAALGAIEPPPSLVVSSGTAEHRHAYWLLSEPVPVSDLEQANRRLAHALGADLACAEPARILRAAPSLNHKHHPAGDVRVEHCKPDERCSLGDVLRFLPECLDDVPIRRRVALQSVVVADDALLEVPPRVYVERLLAVTVPRHGKVCCPFHDDRTPSLHVYAEPERGWYCYGCGRGGSIYDLASLVRGVTTRGRDFVALRRELLESMQ